MTGRTHTRIVFAALLVPLVAAVAKMVGGALVVAVWLAQGRFTPAPSTVVATPVEWAFAAATTVRASLVGFPEVSLPALGMHVLGLAATVAVYGLVFEILPRRRREHHVERGLHR
jgi:hypothetical protein